VPDPRQERLEAAARLYDDAASELDLAARHARVAAEHFRNGEVPRGSAHAWATRGHLLNAQQHLDQQARTHSGTSNLPD
jgi:hypothetical protein